METCSTFFEIARNLDRLLFLLINHDADSRWLDRLMLALRHPLGSLPVYSLVLWGAFRALSPAQLLKFICCSLFVILVADPFCAQVLKPFFARSRPCCDPWMEQQVRMLIPCGGVYSFPSNHATNHFAMAAFWYRSFYAMTGRRYRLLWLWAAAIGYAQVYVGKHYPADILCGALLGILIGQVVFLLARRMHTWPVCRPYTIARGVQKS